MIDPRQPSTGFLPINGTRISWEAIGSGRPLVLIHAGISDLRMWDDQFAEFSSSHQVVRYDMRGFGNSRMESGSFSHHEDLAELLRALDLQSAVVCASSFGGRVAIDFAIEHADQINALVVAGPALGGYRMSAVLDAFEDEIDEALSAGDIPRAAEVDLRVWVDGPHRRPHEVDQEFRERARVMAERVYEVASTSGVPRWLEPPAIERLSEIRVPVLVIVGALDQPDMLRIADLLESRIARCRKIVMPGTAHLPSMERSTEFNLALRTFLDAMTGERA